MTDLVKVCRVADIYTLLLEDFGSLKRMFVIAYESQKFNHALNRSYDINGLPPGEFIGTIRHKIIGMQCCLSYEQFLEQREIAVFWYSLIECLPFLEEKKNFSLVEETIVNLENLIGEIRNKFN